MNEPVTVTYSLEEVLQRIEDKLDKIDERLTTIDIGQARLEEKVDALGKRLDNQEFISRGVLIGLMVALLGGLAKIFGLVGTP
ncbi:MAG: hypothetical protein QNJ37_08920 [Crocosphaera sp.]|nr:hypothetical protein [Crocosphaera sp.]